MYNFIWKNYSSRNLADLLKQAGKIFKDMKHLISYFILVT